MNATGQRLTMRLGKANAAHLYDVDVERDGERKTVEVQATNRDQAARIAEAEGYTVRSCNMVG